MKTVAMITMKKSFLLLIAGCTLSAATYAQEAVKDTVQVNKEKSNETNSRNVMLNASSANGPREISIGLPGGDVNVLENGLPVVYNSNPHNVNTHWRGDGSLGHVGLLKISETAITTGTVGYAVNSHTQLGTEKFQGKLNYNTNHFGKQQIDLNISGNAGKGWFYSGSIYQDFDPGTFKLRFASNQDRTQIYKAAITKRYHQDRGELSVIYHYSNSRWPSNAATNAPFMYVGDGSVKEIPGFKLGTSSYLPTTGEMVYMDMRSGELKKTNLYDASLNKGNQISLHHAYKWDNGLKWIVNAKYDHALGSYVYQTPMSLEKKTSEDGYSLKDLEGNLTPYEGYVQSRMSCLNRGNIDETFLTSELSREYKNGTWRIGLNQWHYKIDYASNTTMYDHTVEEYPSRLMKEGYTDGVYYDFNKNASEYYKGYENKLALYFTHDWDINDKINVYYGARFEYQKMHGQNAAVYLRNDSVLGRFPNYHLGAAYNKNGQTGTVAPQDFDYNWFNQVYTFALTYKLSGQFGFTGDFTYNTQHPAISSFAPSELPNVEKVSIPLGRAGIYYNNNWLSLTSLFSYIGKTNNNSTLNLINPNNSKDINAAPLSYDIKTIGWTTDLIAKLFRGFDLHFLFTYQNPTYKKYETGVNFSDGSYAGINATGNIVTEIPKVLLEIDPSYTYKDLRVWLSARYFSKTYANINNAYYFNGRWETFGGVNYKVNKYLSLGATVVNILNQTGARGSISGAELDKKEDASKHNGQWMAGSYIRPFTVEFSANITF